MEFHLCDSLFRFLHNEPHSFVSAVFSQHDCIIQYGCYSKTCFAGKLISMFEKEDVAKMYDYGERGLL